MKIKSIKDLKEALINVSKKGNGYLEVMQSIDHYPNLRIITLGKKTITQET